MRRQGTDVGEQEIVASIGKSTTTTFVSVSNQFQRGGDTMSSKSCVIDGELQIVTQDGPIQCLGMGNSLDLVFRSVSQLVRARGPIQSNASPVANGILAAARHAGIQVRLRIGRRIVGSVTSVPGRNRPSVKLRLLNLAIAGFTRLS